MTNGFTIQKVKASSLTQKIFLKLKYFTPSLILTGLNNFHKIKFKQVFLVRTGSILKQERYEIFPY